MRTLEGIDTLINFCCITPYLVAMLEDMRTLEGIDTGYILAPSPWWLTKLEDMRTLEGIDTYQILFLTEEELNVRRYENP